MNMSYCRFRNTLLALEDCKDTMSEEMYEEEKLSQEEEIAKKNLIKICQEIAEEFGEKK